MSYNINPRPLAENSTFWDISVATKFHFEVIFYLCTSPRCFWKLSKNYIYLYHRRWIFYLSQLVQILSSKSETVVGQILQSERTYFISLEGAYDGGNEYFCHFVLYRVQSTVYFSFLSKASTILHYHELCPILYKPF